MVRDAQAVLQSELGRLADDSVVWFNRESSFRLKQSGSPWSASVRRESRPGDEPRLAAMGIRHRISDSAATLAMIELLVGCVRPSGCDQIVARLDSPSVASGGSLVAWVCRLVRAPGRSRSGSLERLGSPSQRCSSELQQAFARCCPPPWGSSCNPALLDAVALDPADVPGRRRAPGRRARAASAAVRRHLRSRITIWSTD